MTNRICLQLVIAGCVLHENHNNHQSINRPRTLGSIRHCFGVFVMTELETLDEVYNLVCKGVFIATIAVIGIGAWLIL